jgi:hypothetical protein
MGGVGYNDGEGIVVVGKGAPGSFFRMPSWICAGRGRRGVEAAAKLYGVSQGAGDQVRVQQAGSAREEAEIVAARSRFCRSADDFVDGGIERLQADFELERTRRERREASRSSVGIGREHPKWRKRPGSAADVLGRTPGFGRRAGCRD